MKHVLNITDLTEDFFTDTRLLGIMVATKSYRFCWQLNNLLAFNFRLNTDIEIHVQRKERQYFFPVYQHTEPNNYLTHYVYQNQYDGEYLLPEFRHLDFLWLMKGDLVTDADYTQLLQKIKQVNGVQLVAELTNEKIKNKGNLLF